MRKGERVFERGRIQGRRERERERVLRVVMSGGTADFFYREARRLKFVARSAFKLLEIQNKHRIIRPGGSVLDLGCAPGAFLQVACQFLGPIEKGGAVVGVDVKKVKVPADHCDVRVRTYCADVLKISATSLASLSPSGCGYSVIVSDMCPAVSGIGSKDAALSGELGLQALHLALGQPESDDELPGRSGGILLPGGSLVIKLLEGEESQDEEENYYSALWNFSISGDHDDIYSIARSCFVCSNF